MVLDASALVEYLRATPAGHRVRERMTRAGAVRHIPDLAPAEVASALRGLVLGGKVAAARAEAALSDLSAIKARRHRIEPLLPRAWTLRENLTVYDAVYVALAESLGATLVVCDRKFDTPLVRSLIELEVIS